MAPETGFIIAASVVFVGLVTAIVKLTRHFAAPEKITVTAEWVDRLSGDASFPLQLLNGDSQTIRSLLPVLKSDFKLVSQGVKAIIVQSKRDRPDLAWALMRRQIAFSYYMTVVRLQLAWRRLASPFSRP